MSKLCVAGIVLLSLVAAAPARADEWSKKYSVSAKPNLRVDVNDGSIEIFSTDQKEIEVRITTVGWEIPKDIHITESQSGDNVTLEVRVPHANFNFFGSLRRSLKVEIHIPRQADLDARTGDGNIRSQAVSGRIRLYSGDGNISTEGLSGDARLHTGDGRIEGSGFDGALDADTGDGHITVRGRFDALNLKTGDGHIDAEAQSGSKMASSWSARSGDGNITLRLPSSFSAELDAHTGDGRISLDFPVTISGELSSSTVRGKMGAGGSPLLIRTGDGSIRIDRG